jgi:hypothetical protein
MIHAKIASSRCFTSIAANVVSDACDQVFHRADLRQFTDEREAGAGMEPAGAERHGRSPEGVSERARANQSNGAGNKGPFRNKAAL